MKKGKLGKGLAKWEDKEHAKYLLIGSLIVFSFWLLSLIK